MKLGILTAPFPDAPLATVADWASSAGFETLEIACWPKSAGPNRRYAGTTHIDVARISASEAKEIVVALSEKCSFALAHARHRGRYRQDKNPVTDRFIASPSSVLVTMASVHLSG